MNTYATQLRPILIDLAVLVYLETLVQVYRNNTSRYVY